MVVEVNMLSKLIFPAAMPKEQFCNFTGAAYNDPFSNVVFLGESSSLSSSTLIESLASGTYPSECLGPFLHECTHHRCFDSPVGRALHAIEGMSRASWWQTLECRAVVEPGDVSFEKCKLNKICFNRSLVRELFEIFSPMAEGLALYGELDALPGQSPAASQMLCNALSVFFEREVLNRGHSGILLAYQDYADWLANERMREEGTFAATRVQLKELGDEAMAEGNPYILGYPWVKGLISTLHKHSEEARSDTDASLAFLCSFFFDDCELAYRIVKSSWSMIEGKPSQTTEDICNYLRSRKNQLDQPEVASFYSQYVKALSVNDSISNLPFLNYDENYRVWLEMARAQAAASELYWQAAKSADFRHILRFGVVLADEMVINAEEGSVACNIEKFSVKVPALPDGIPTDTGKEGRVANGMEASVEFVLFQRVVLICFLFKDSLVAVTDRRFKPVPQEFAEQTLGEMTSFLHNEWWRNKHWMLLDPSSEVTCGAYLQSQVREARNLARRIYH